jgi:exosome complex component RRP46
MRPLFCQVGVSGRCDGSANMACGKTAVTAAVFGPVEARAQKERVDCAVVDVSARLMAPSASGSALEARARETLIRGVIEACILSAAHPRTAVHVSIHQVVRYVLSTL